MNKKNFYRPQIGHSLVRNSTNHVVEEMFTADSIRWVRCTKLRRKLRVWIGGKRQTIYDTENTYLTESEWIKLYKEQVKV